MGKLKFDEKEGYTFISNNGIEYELLEGKSLGGKTSSDICFIVQGYRDDDTHDFCRNNDISEFVGWIYGANFIYDKGECYRDDFIKDIESIINDYEKSNSKLIEYFKRNIVDESFVQDLKTFYYDETREEIPSDEEIKKQLKENPMEFIKNMMCAIKDLEARI